MNKKKNNLDILTIDKNFIPASMDEEDELYPNGIFVFNITKMMKHIRDHQAEFLVENMKVKQIRDGFSNLNEDHIDSVDVTSPIILAEISPGRYNVIDGNHRLEKAFRMGLKCIPAYVLKPRQHIQFLTSLKGYHAYIDYWNLKLKDDRI